jgi:hypothetical protein
MKVIHSPLTSPRSFLRLQIYPHVPVSDLATVSFNGFTPKANSCYEVGHFFESVFF